MPLSERELVVLEDLEHLCSVVSKPDPENVDLRVITPILRRLLVEKELEKITNIRRLPLSIQVPDTRAVVRACKGAKIAVYQSASVSIFGVYIATLMLSQGRQSPRLPGYHPDLKTSMSLVDFRHQQVFFAGGQFITREAVIKYVANKAGGVHFDDNRKGDNHRLDMVRKMIEISLPTNQPGPSISVSPIPRSSVIPRLEISTQHIDPVLLEILCTGRFLCESPELASLISDLSQARYE